LIYWQALGVAPENCLVIEDSIIGLKVFWTHLQLSWLLSWDALITAWIFLLVWIWFYCQDANSRFCSRGIIDVFFKFLLINLNPCPLQAASGASMPCIISFTSSTSAQVRSYSYCHFTSVVDVCSLGTRNMSWNKPILRTETVKDLIVFSISIPFNYQQQLIYWYSWLGLSTNGIKCDVAKAGNWCAGF